MLPMPASQVFAGLLVLLLAVLPLGCVLLRGAERALGRKFGLSVPERILLAVFATGALLFVVASVPLGIFDQVTVVGSLVAGGVAYAAVSVRERGAGLRAAARFLRSWPGAILAAASVGLLAVEVAGAPVLLPNGVDGTVYSLFVNVLLRNGGVAWTLQPFANTGVLYPQGAPVWMTLPVLLFGWPIVASPVVLPPLFLSLTIGAAYSLGDRMAPRVGLAAPWVGLVFAGYFGAVASWPRLYVAGSYDFIFALPMFLLTLGLLASYVDRSRLGWPETAGFALLIGALTSVSVAVGTSLLVLLGAYLVAARLRGPIRSWGGVVVRWLAVVGVSLAFVARSLIGFVIWFGYPGHVLTDTGSPPYSPLLTQETYSGWATQLDPFVLWKPKISPFPPLFVELEILLIAGLVLGGWSIVRPGGSAARWVPVRLARWLFVGTSALLLETSALLALGAVNTSVSGVQSITNVWETSILLFVFYSLVALLPILGAARRMGGSRPPDTPRPPGEAGPRRHTGVVRRKPASVVICLLLLALPLITGVALVPVVPGYLNSTITAEAGATAADLGALQWSGTHLPACSRVLVAPGSAAQYIPEYAAVHMVFPVFPSPTNASYKLLVSDLSDGVYSATTRAAMLELGLTEVFATGATTNAYPPFQTAELTASTDFRLAYSDGDALVFVFLPGATPGGCEPS